MDELKSIETAVKSATESVEKMKAANEAAIADVKNQVAEVKAAVVTMDEASKKNQAALDQLIAEKSAKKVDNKNKSFGEAYNEAIAEAFEAKQAELKEFQKNKNAKLTIDLKSVGTMTLGNNLSGDGVATYNQRQGLVPAQKITCVILSLLLYLQPDFMLPIVRLVLRVLSESRLRVTQRARLTTT